MKTRLLKKIRNRFEIYHNGKWYIGKDKKTGRHTIPAKSLVNFIIQLSEPFLPYSNTYWLIKKTRIETNRILKQFKKIN